MSQPFFLINYGILLKKSIMYVMLEQYHFLKCEKQFFSFNIINSPYRGLRVSIHVPNQIIGTFVPNLQFIHAKYRLKPPFARKDQIRIFLLEKSLHSYTYERIAT